MTDPNDRFAIIPLTHGPAPSDAIATGSMSAVMERIVDSKARADALEEAARAVEDAVEAQQKRDEALATTARTIADTVDLVTSRLDAFVARRAERIRRDAEREAEAEAKRIQDELNAMPDPDNPDPLAHHPGGELHMLPAKVESEGDLPKELQTPRVPPEPPEVKGFVYPQPTAISLNKE